MKEGLSSLILTCLRDEYDEDEESGGRTAGAAGVAGAGGEKALTSMG